MEFCIDYILYKECVNTFKVFENDSGYLFCLRKNLLTFILPNAQECSIFYCDHFLANSNLTRVFFSPFSGDVHVWEW